MAPDVTLPDFYFYTASDYTTEASITVLDPFVLGRRRIQVILTSGYNPENVVTTYE